MFKYLKSILLIAILAIFLMPQFSLAQRADAVNIYFFYGDGCPHCKKEMSFLNKLAREDGGLKVHYFETWYNQENARLAKKVIKEMNVHASGVPVTFIGNSVINGYLNEETTGEEIKRLITYHRAAKTEDIIKDIIFSTQEEKKEQAKGESIIYGDNTTAPPTIINLPLVGAVNTQKVSLFGMTLIIGFLDGFNPCAMWVLVFLISMLIGMKNRRRMWAIGFAFITASAVVYFMFLAAWLNVFLFIGFIFWIRLLIALVAVSSGIYHLREFFVNKDATCKVVNPTKRTKIMNQIKSVINEKSFLLALIGIIGLAAAVNMIELVCSAGLPAIYTSILSAANLAGWQYYGYMLLYIIIFMLDDMAVFVIAMITLQITGVTQKYVRAANLIGGIVMLLIGILLIFKPGWILFG